MSDRLRTDDSRALDAGSDADRDAKIEQLLLIGLDQYFAAQYDQAINVWTRALFLDRSHPRARAYIERARSALAERQRESEELLQNGVAAFQRGDGAEARRLLQAAIDGGAPPDEALAVLDRLNRLDKGAAARPPRSSRDLPRLSAPDARVSSASRVRLAVMISMLLLAIVAASAIGIGSWNPTTFDWRSLLSLQDAPAASSGAPISRDVALPLPRRAETALARARTLVAGGRLRDALAVLDTIRLTDTQKTDADRLRAEIQRQLLGLASPASTTAPDAAARDKPEGRQP
jgi:tetratricopeptide (TPR) repeat protein